MKEQYDSLEIEVIAFDSEDVITTSVLEFRRVLFRSPHRHLLKIMSNCCFIDLYRFADKNIEIRSIFSDIRNLCEAYQVNGVPDFTISTTRSDIDFERVKSSQEDAFEGIPTRQFSDGYLESLAIYRKIAEILPEYDTLLFHGSCVAVDGIGYLFTAKSGTGKSTHTRLWRELLGSRAVMVNDDKPLIRVTEDGAIVYGTPWDGKHRLSTNIAVPLKALCILERAENNTIHPISAGEAYPMLLQQAYRPMDGTAMRKTLTLIDKLAASVNLWRLGCNTDIEAAELAYHAMKG